MGVMGCALSLHSIANLKIGGFVYLSYYLISLGVHQSKLIKQVYNMYNVNKSSILHNENKYIIIHRFIRFYNLLFTKQINMK